MTESHQSEDEVSRIRLRHKAALDAGMNNADASAYANDPNSPALSSLSSAQVQSSTATASNGSSGAQLDSGCSAESVAMSPPLSPKPALSVSADNTGRHELDTDRLMTEDSSLPESPDGTRPSDSPPDYGVGYGRAPVESRFKNGHKKLGGRQKGQRNITTVVDGFLDERVTVHEGKQARRMSKRDAMCLRIVNAAVSGNDKAQSKIIALTTAAKPAEATTQEPFTADDEAVIADFLRRSGNHGQSTSAPNNNANPNTGEVKPPRTENNEKKDTKS
jgi:hypothetical protein